MAKSPQGFIVVLPGEIIEIAQDDDISWLTFFYALPKELVWLHERSGESQATLDR
mgnify:CR=1 FL=1